MNYIYKMTSYTIRQLLEDLEHSTLIYRISELPWWRQDIAKSITEDQLHRHVISEFDDCQLDTNGYDIITVRGRNYLTLTVSIQEEAYDEDHLSHRARLGWLKIPHHFTDIVHTIDETTNGGLPAMFEFVKIRTRSRKLRNYVTVV